MRESTFTGQYIYDKIAELRNKVSNINKGIDELDGGDCEVARDILKQQLGQVSRELSDLTSIEYIRKA